MSVGQVICDIIATDMSLDSTRVVEYGQDYKAPSDSGIYIILSQGDSKVLSYINIFDYHTNKEIKKVNTYTPFTAEITSKNHDAVDRKEEILMAIISQYSLEKQEENQFKVFRAGNIIDLTFIEGTSSLYRFNVPLIVAHTKTKKTGVTYFNKFQSVEVIEDE